MTGGNPLGEEAVLCCVRCGGDAGEVEPDFASEALDLVIELESVGHGSLRGLRLIIRSRSVTVLGRSEALAYNAVVENLDHLLVGSCSFTAEGWERTFYPPGLKKSGYLGYYAEQFKSVEVDATFYRIPAEKTVRGWFAQTPQDFVFACKVPQSITHESCLVDCDSQFREFVNVMSLLEHKLGPMLFQFPYFNKKVFPRPRGIFRQATGFLPKLPSGFQFALEIRNKAWVGPELLDLLREHQGRICADRSSVDGAPGRVDEEQRCRDV